MVGFAFFLGVQSSIARNRLSLKSPLYSYVSMQPRIFNTKIIFLSLFLDVATHGEASPSFLISTKYKKLCKTPKRDSLQYIQSLFSAAISPPLRGSLYFLLLTTLFKNSYRSIALFNLFLPLWVLLCLGVVLVCAHLDIATMHNLL